MAVESEFSAALQGCKALVTAASLVASDARQLTKLARLEPSSSLPSSSSSSSSQSVTSTAAGSGVDTGSSQNGGGNSNYNEDVGGEAFLDVLKHAAKMISFAEDLVRRVRVTVEDLQLSHVLASRSAGGNQVQGGAVSANLQQQQQQQEQQASTQGSLSEENQTLDPVLIGQLGELLAALTTTSMQAKIRTIELVKAVRLEALLPPSDRLQAMSKELYNILRQVVNAAELMGRRLRDAEKKALRGQFKSTGRRQGIASSLKQRAKFFSPGSSGGSTAAVGNSIPAASSSVASEGVGSVFAIDGDGLQHSPSSSRRAVNSTPAITGSDPGTPSSVAKSSSAWRKARFGIQKAASGPLKRQGSHDGSSSKAGSGDGFARLLSTVQVTTILASLHALESASTKVIDAVMGVATVRRSGSESAAAHILPSESTEGIQAPSHGSGVLGGAIEWDELAATFVEPSKTTTMAKDQILSILSPDLDLESAERTHDSLYAQAVVRLHRRTNEFLEMANMALHDSSKSEHAVAALAALHECSFWCALWTQNMCTKPGKSLKARKSEPKVDLPNDVPAALETRTQESVSPNPAVSVETSTHVESTRAEYDSEGSDDSLASPPHEVDFGVAPEAWLSAHPQPTASPGAKPKEIMAQVGLPLMNVVKTILVSDKDTPDDVVERVFSKHYASSLRSSSDRAAETSSGALPHPLRSPDGFQLKVPGRPEYLTGNSSTVANSRYVTTCLMDGRRVELVLVEKLETLAMVQSMPEAVRQAEEGSAAAAADDPPHVPRFSGPVGEQLAAFERLGKEELAMMIVDYGIKAADMRELFSQDTFLHRRSKLKSEAESLIGVMPEEKRSLVALIEELDVIVERTFDQYEGLRQVADMRGVRGCGELLVREGAASVALFRKMMISAQVVIVESELRAAHASQGGAAPKYRVGATTERMQRTSDRLFACFRSLKTGLLAETGNVSSLRELDAHGLTLNCSLARKFVHEILEAAAEHMRHVRRRFEDKVRELELLSLPEEVQLSVFTKYRGPVQFDMAVETEFANIRPWVQEWISVQVPSIVQREIMAPTREDLLGLLDANNRQMVAGFKGLLDGQILEPLLTLQNLFLTLCDEVQLVHFAYS